MTLFSVRWNMFSVPDPVRVYLLFIYRSALPPLSFLPCFYVLAYSTPQFDLMIVFEAVVVPSAVVIRHSADTDPAGPVPRKISTTNLVALGFIRSRPLLSPRRTSSPFT